MTDNEATIYKTAIAAAQRSAGTAAVKIWRVINQPNPAAAVAYINKAPAQGAGEAAYSNRSDGSVDVYYFL